MRGRSGRRRSSDARARRCSPGTPAAPALPSGDARGARPAAGVADDRRCAPDVAGASIGPFTVVASAGGADGPARPTVIDGPNARARGRRHRDPGGRAVALTRPSSAGLGVRGGPAAGTPRGGSAARTARGGSAARTARGGSAARAPRGARPLVVLEFRGAERTGPSSRNRLRSRSVGVLPGATSMPLIDCPRCRASFRTGAIYEQLPACPRCGAPLDQGRSRNRGQGGGFLRRSRPPVEPDWEAITGAQYARRPTRPVDRMDADSPPRLTEAPSRLEGRGSSDPKARNGDDRLSG